MTVAETDIPPAELTTSMVLTRALEILNATGWCKGVYNDGDQHCMAGAVFEAVLDPNQRYAAIRALENVLNGVALTVWNDNDMTEYDDVVYVFNQAIKATTPQEENNGV